MDANNIQLRDALQAAERLSAIIRVSQGVGDPEPGSEVARLLTILAFVMPEHRVSKISRH